MTTQSAIRPQVRGVSATTFILIAAWVVASLEGYDLAVYGVSVPAILGDPSLGIDKAEAGTIGSLVGIGMLVGAALAGALLHRTGPRRLLLVGTTVFSLGMAVCTFAGGVPRSAPDASSSASASVSSCRRSTPMSPTSASRAAAAVTSP